MTTQPLTPCDSDVEGRGLPAGCVSESPNKERGEGPIARNVATARHP